MIFRPTWPARWAELLSIVTRLLNSVQAHTWKELSLGVKRFRVIGEDRRGLRELGAVGG